MPAQPRQGSAGRISGGEGLKKAPGRPALELLLGVTGFVQCLLRELP